MIDLLSMPRRHQLNGDVLRTIKMQSGLPINSLPGWDQIPLNCKLPMLKCPGNQVIFSKNKIGMSLRNLKQEFDTSGLDAIPEYNPLHDSNLRSFYSNERNLTRLRENGEITQNNDVICTLKDFNEYRQQLHKAQLYYVLRELDRLEKEHNDRMLVTNAETIAKGDHHTLMELHNTPALIQERRLKQIEMRAERFRKLWEKTELRFQRIAGLEEMQRVLMEHRKALNQMRLQAHLDIYSDMERKRMIALKKLLEFKKNRLRRNLRMLNAKRERALTEGQLESWQQRLNERINYQQHITNLIAEAGARRKVFIQNHQNRYFVKWDKIQEEIRQRTIARKNANKKKKRKRPKPVFEPPKPCNELVSYCDDFEESFNRLLDTELCDALNTVIDIDEKISLPFHDDDPIYKAAKFITNHILMKFDKDLSNDKELIEFVSLRVERYFHVAKRFVMFRATQIITATRDPEKEPGKRRSHERGSLSSIVNFTRRPTLAKYVSFSKIRDNIGQSSYEIHPEVDVRDVSERKKTPAGSLASIIINRNEEEEEEDAELKKEMEQKEKREQHLNRNAKIFIEYYIIKFKRELVVGMGRRVFGAIDCHFQNKIMDVRKELLELDNKFVVCQMAKSILGYARNPLDFDACVKLCISKFSSEIIWSLQKHLLRPERDPRGIVKPHQCTNCEADRMKLCLYCDR